MMKQTELRTSPLVGKPLQKWSVVEYLIYKVLCVGDTQIELTKTPNVEKDD